MGLEMVGFRNLIKAHDADLSDVAIHNTEGFDSQCGDLKTGHYSAERDPIRLPMFKHSAWIECRERLAKMCNWPLFYSMLFDEIKILEDKEKNSTCNHEAMEFKFSINYLKSYPRQSIVYIPSKRHLINNLKLSELIYFTDSSGCICSEVCKKISNDLNGLIFKEKDILFKVRSLFNWASNNNGIVVFR